MLLDEHLAITRQKNFQPVKKLDWIFSLTGFFFLFFSITYILFFPFQPAEIFYFGEFIITPFSSILMAIAFFFFLIGGVYAILQRFLNLQLSYALSIIHLIFSIIIVLMLLWVLGNEIAFIQFSNFGVYRSSTPIFEIFLSTQIIFVVNVLQSVFRKI